MRLSNGLELTAEQESNLRKLAYFHLRGIEASPMGFTMQVFCRTSAVKCGQLADIYARDENAGADHCGAVGCMIGHGTFAGIAADDGESWQAYCSRVFLPVQRDAEQWPHEWQWCFDSVWAATDNTPAGGGKRIIWLLDRGLPSDWREQMLGRAPLCYADWTPELPPEIEEQVPADMRLAVCM